MLDSLMTAATHITDHNWSFYGIIAEKRKKVNNFFHIFRIFSIFSEKKKKNYHNGIYRADAQNAKLGVIVLFSAAGAYLPPGGRWIFRFAPWKGKTEKTDEERRNLKVQKKPDMVRKP